MMTLDRQAEGIAVPCLPSCPRTAPIGIMGATSSKKVNPELADLVSAADTDKDGIITAEELGAMLQAKGFDWPRQRMEKLLGALDEDGDGSVTLAEFIKGAEQLLAVVGALHSMGVEQQLAAKAEEHHQAHLPPALAAWEPLGKTAAVKEAAAGLKELEAAFAKGPSGEAAEALHAKTEKIGAAMKSVIDQRITEDKIVPRCDAAIQEGGDAFTAVYDAVSHSIEFTEAEGVKAHWLSHCRSAPRSIMPILISMIVRTARASADLPARPRAYLIATSRSEVVLMTANSTPPLPSPFQKCAGSTEPERPR